MLLTFDIYLPLILQVFWWVEIYYTGHWNELQSLSRASQLACRQVHYVSIDVLFMPNTQPATQHAKQKPGFVRHHMYTHPSFNYGHHVVTPASLFYFMLNWFEHNMVFCCTSTLMVYWVVLSEKPCWYLIICSLPFSLKRYFCPQDYSWLNLF